MDKSVLTIGLCMLFRNLDTYPHHMENNKNQTKSTVRNTTINWRRLRLGEIRKQSI